MPISLLRIRVLCLALILCLCAAPLHADFVRGFQPLPPKIVFPDPDHPSLPDPETAAQVRAEIDSSFADLNKVTLARERLIRRFGLVSVPALIDSLRSAQSHAWNAALTLAALRDVMGPAESVQRALPALHRMLASGGESYGRAFAALAIGCYPWTEGRESSHQPAFRSVPGPAGIRKAARAALRKARETLFVQATSNGDVLGKASLLALAKMGGKDAANLLADVEPKFTIRYRQAVLLARAFARTDDPALIYASLGAQQVEAVAAALSISVSLLVEDRPAWTRERKTIQTALQRLQIKNRLEVAEALFARGMNALVNEAPDDEWGAIWKATVAPKVETVVSEAGAQALLFCDRRRVREKIVRWVAEPPVPPKPAMRSMLMLRAGELATPEAIQACIAWIRNKSTPPRPSKDWDPRWYAIVGLLRAAHHQRLTDPELRKAVVDALVRARDKVIHKDAPFHKALGDVLKQYGATLKGASRFSRAALDDIERSMPDQWGLLARDARDLCAFRVNRQVEEIFDFGSIKASTADDKQIDKQPERYLKRYLAMYPYFSRLQFQSDRGTRDPIQFDESKPEGLDR